MKTIKKTLIEEIDAFINEGIENGKNFLEMYFEGVSFSHTHNGRYAVRVYENGMIETGTSLGNKIDRPSTLDINTLVDNIKNGAKYKHEARVYKAEVEYLNDKIESQKQEFLEQIKELRNKIERLKESQYPIYYPIKDSKQLNAVLAKLRNQ